MHLGALWMDLVDLGVDLGALRGGLAALGDYRQNRRDRTHGILGRTIGFLGRAGSVRTSGILGRTSGTPRQAGSRGNRESRQNKRGSSAENPANEVPAEPNRFKESRLSAKSVVPYARGVSCS